MIKVSSCRYHLRDIKIGNSQNNLFLRIVVCFPEREGVLFIKHIFYDEEGINSDKTLDWNPVHVSFPHACHNRLIRR